MVVKTNKYARFFALLKQAKSNGLIITKEEAVSVASFGRTDSLSSLSIEELKAAEHYLSKLTQSSSGMIVSIDMATGKDMSVQSHWRMEKGKPVQVSRDDAERDRMRKAIIAIFKSIGRTTADAIAWAEKYGVYGAKRKFNDYDKRELWQLIKNAENVKADAIAAVNKKLRKGGK